MHYPKVWTLNHRRQRAWIFPCWFQPSSLVTCPTLYTYLMPLWLRGPLSHFVAEIIRSGAMENSAWALRLLTGECSICSYQYNSLPSELPLLHSTTNQTSSQYLSDFWAIFPGHDREAVGDAIYGLKITAPVALKAGCRVRGCAARPGFAPTLGSNHQGFHREKQWFNQHMGNQPSKLGIWILRPQANWGNPTYGNETLLLKIPDLNGGLHYIVGKWSN